MLNPIISAKSDFFAFWQTIGVDWGCNDKQKLDWVSNFKKKIPNIPVKFSTRVLYLELYKYKSSVLVCSFENSTNLQIDIFNQ